MKKNRFRPSEIPILSAPITSSNRRNAKNNPAVNLGKCTPFQLFESSELSQSGSVLFLGNPAKGIKTAQALIRRRQKPFLFLGTAADSDSVFSAFEPEWTANEVSQILPRGNGAIYLTKPFADYILICKYLEDWAQEYFIIMHLGNGLQVGAELMNLLNAIDQVVLFCDAVPQSLRNSDMWHITPLEFMKQIHYLFVFSSGAETGELIQLLPKYQYERISNTSGFNAFNSRSIFHPFHSHPGYGFSVNQQRTLEFKKDLFETDELKKLFNAGYLLVFNAGLNTVFIAQLI